MSRSILLLLAGGLLPLAALTQTAPLPAAPGPAPAGTLGPLTVEKIMREPADWMGGLPSEAYWSEDGRHIYFQWNPNRARHDSLYETTPAGGAPRPVPLAAQRQLSPARGEYDLGYTRKAYELNGDIYLLDLKTGRTRRATNTAERESNPGFALGERLVSYTRAGNLFTWDPATGETVQRTDFRAGPPPPKAAANPQQQFLRAEQLALFEVIRARDQDRRARERQQKALTRLQPKAIYLGAQTVENLQLSPDGRFVTYTLVQPSTDKVAIVPSFVTASGFTEDLNTRGKVGAAQRAYELGIYDVGRDTTFVLGCTSV